MRDGQLNIHSENILPIIKKWLYSEKDIFVRELAANGSDAIQKLSILRSRGEAGDIAEPKITLIIDKENKTLTFSDTGIGLDEEEAEKFLSQIAFSGAEEFIKTYQLNDTFIGHFGLGFFSAFMVAESVEVVSRSYKEGATPIRWKSDGSASYTIEEAEREQIGTDVILHIGAEHEEYLDEHKMTAILRRFCAFFPHPLFLNEKHINEQEPLWQKAPAECTEEDYKSFYNTLYPFEEPPLFWIHLNVDYPFHVKGILYFPRFKREVEPAKSHVKLFCNRVFVSDDCKDILPEYLSLLRGVLDSPDIPLNVSRSHLQVDKTVRQLAQHIAKKVADALSNLSKHERERFIASWPAYEIVLKLGMLQDPKFYSKVKELLIFKTTGSEYKTLEELCREEDGKKSIIYCEEGQEKSPLLSAFTSKGTDVAILTSPIDHPLMSKLEHEEGYQFRRIDAALDSRLVDSSKEKSVLDASGRTEGSKIADFFRSALDSKNTEVEAKSLEAENIPAMITLSEEERRFRDYMNRVSGEKNPIQPKATLIVNTNSPLVQAVFELHSSSPELAKLMALNVWDLTKLSHRELEADELHSFTERSTRLLEEMATKIVS